MMRERHKNTRSTDRAVYAYTRKHEQQEVARAGHVLGREAQQQRDDRLAQEELDELDIPVLKVRL